MPVARDLAADLLLRIERIGGRVREGLAAVRGELDDPRERGLLTELAYGCTRQRGTLDAVLATASRRPLRRLNAAVRTALRVALHQVLYLDRVPAHAAVNHAVDWARGHVGRRRAGYVNACLRGLVRDLEGAARGPDDARRDVPREDGSRLRFRSPRFPDPATDPAANLAARFSMPGWLTERWLERWGALACESVLRAGITRPPLTLRARGERGALATTLKARDIPFEMGPVDTALVLPAGETGALTCVRAGQAAVQDATSQRVAPLLEPEAGQRVLDLCAAPGGKSLHLRDLMGSGLLVACDVDPERLQVLEALRPSMGELAYEVLGVPPDGALLLTQAPFDGVLVDAPCSNTGVLRRRVEARWRLGAADIRGLARKQVDLLERALPLLDPQGRLVYSTCSIEEEENEQVLERVLEQHPDLEAEIAFRAWPGPQQDGGFAAVIRRQP